MKNARKPFSYSRHDYNLVSFCEVPQDALDLDLPSFMCFQKGETRKFSNVTAENMMNE